MLSFKFNKSKAISAVLYVANELINREGIKRPDLHKIFKVLYFADEKHLAKYGRPVIGDRYIAMTYGPVPSTIYDIFKLVRGDETFICDSEQFSKYFDVESHFIQPKQEPDMEELSQSDLECINESLQENQALSFKQLVNKSHDLAYKKAAKDDKISFREMAKVAGANETMLSYIKTLAENEQAIS